MPRGLKSSVVSENSVRITFHRTGIVDIQIDLVEIDLTAMDLTNMVEGAPTSICVL